MDYWKLIISVVICQMAGVIGSIFTTSAIPRWYAKLKKPSFNPPNWVFGPVWTLLFLMMGISLYIVWNTGITQLALIAFAAQLILNILWSIIFFGFKSPKYALIEIVALWITIFFTIISFYGISAIAALLLVPCLLWVTFAAILNYFVWVLN